jgi:hypothetical protein
MMQLANNNEQIAMNCQLAISNVSAANRYLKIANASSFANGKLFINIEGGRS